MKNTRIILMSIPGVVFVASLIGFLIAFPSSSQAAYARIFIDLGVMIAVICAVMALPKPTVLPTDEIADSLRDLARGRYDKRLIDQDFGELSPIAQAFNELAGALSDSRNLDPTHVRYKIFNKDSKVQAIAHGGHSYHPELGQVKVLPNEVVSPAPVHEIKGIEAKEKEEEVAVPTVPEAPFEADALYEEFRLAHLSVNQIVVDFQLFKATIDKARQDLLEAHNCKDVRFEVVTESNEVALRPRLVR